MQVMTWFKLYPEARCQRTIVVHYMDVIFKDRLWWFPYPSIDRRNPRVIFLSSPTKATRDDVESLLHQRTFMDNVKVFPRPLPTYTSHLQLICLYFNQTSWKI